MTLRVSVSDDPESLSCLLWHARSYNRSVSVCMLVWCWVNSRSVDLIRMALKIEHSVSPAFGNWLICLFLISATCGVGICGDVTSVWGVGLLLLLFLSAYLCIPLYFPSQYKCTYKCLPDAATGCFRTKWQPLWQRVASASLPGRGRVRRTSGGV